MRPRASDGASCRRTCLGARATGVAVSDQPDAVAAGDLLMGQVEHMAEQSANRRAEHVQDVQGVIELSEWGDCRGQGR